MSEDTSTPANAEQQVGNPGPRGVRPVALVVLAAIALALAFLWPRLGKLAPALTREDAAALVTATLQRESRQAFVVTGALELTASTRVRNIKRLLPGLLDVNLGSVESTVRAPGKVSYGFQIAALDAGRIRVAGDTIELPVPPVRVYAVEPTLRAMEVRTTSGWLRLGERTQAEVQQRATALIAGTMRRQAEQHLRDSEQPRINTAETLAELLRPAFQAAGIAAPVFRFVLGEHLVYTDGPRAR